MSDDMPLSYARAVGERLRNLRRQQSLSLLAVEEASGREFKASVLGAYERGERIISVLRLQRLAQLYGVPVDQLLPRPRVGGLRFRCPALDQWAQGGLPEPITIDLLRLAALEAPEQEVLQPLREHDPDSAGRLQRPGHHHPQRGRPGPGAGLRARRNGHAETTPGARPGRLNPPAAVQRPKMASQASRVDGLKTMLISLTAARVAVDGTE